MSNGDDPFRKDGGDDWGTVGPTTDDDWGTVGPTTDDNIDMNYGQPLPPPGQQPQYQQQHQPPQHQPPHQQLQPTKQKFDNDDVIAMVVSVFLPGVGHMMMGQVTKGIVILVVSLFTCGGAGLLWVGVLLDLYLVAMTRKYRQLGDWEFLPDANKHLKS